MTTMKTLTRWTLLSAASLGLVTPAIVFAQAENQKANIAVSITAARKANAALMQQYAWDSRTELTEDGTVKDTRVELVNYVNGQVQKSQISDNGPSLPRFGLRKQIAEQKQQEMKQYLGGLKTLLEQYTLGSAGKILDFMNQAQVAGPDGAGLLIMVGNNVVSGGDSLSIWTDARTRQTRRMVVSTTYQGDPISMNATFQTLSSGLTFMNFAQVDIPSKQMSIQVSNFNYNRNN